MERAEGREGGHRMQPHAGRVIAEERPPERVGQVGQPGGREEGGVELAHRDRQLHQQVRRGTPAGAVAHGGAQPADGSTAPADRRRPGDALTQQPRRQAAMCRAQPAGDPGRQEEQRQQREENHAAQDRDQHGRVSSGGPGRRDGAARRQAHGEWQSRQRDGEREDAEPERDLDDTEQQFPQRPDGERRAHRLAGQHGQRTARPAQLSGPWRLARPAPRRPAGG